MSGTDDGFLSRWSRRKQSARQADEVKQPLEAMPDDALDDEASRQDAALVTEIPEPETAEEEAKLLQELGLPAPETLSNGDDFTPFMKAGVPEFLRRRALRRLWRSNPTLAVLDGLNDYDDDFSGGFVKPGTLKTAYEVGKGLVARVQEETAKSEEETPDSETAEEAVSPPVVQTDDSLSAEVEIAEGPDAAEADPPQEEVRATRRRMSFDLTDT